MEKERYDYASAESIIAQKWEQNKTYSFTNQTNKPIFSIDTPPPTVSGSLHIGHVFSYTHTDIIVRFKRMRGFSIFYPMGFDGNGLPTERFVEKKLGIKGHLLKRSEFIKLCLQESQVCEKTFEQLWKRMGLSIDWSLTYSTISDKVRKISQYSFLDLYKKNKVCRKIEPSLYCTTCCTSVAQAELDSAEVATTFNTITFTTKDDTQLLIATTRPELLGACVAVFYNPQDPRYMHLTGKTIITPLYKKEVPLFADDAVQIDKGTGLVMCCTFGDATDIIWFKKYNLESLQVINRQGRCTELTGELAGLKVIEARKKIIELLKADGTLIEQKNIVHNVSTHERCKQEIEYLILYQWFVKILEHKADFLKMGEQVNWYPAFMQSRYRDWVENLNWDWCISRQRFYGIPFPVWYCNDCSQTLVAEPKDLPIDPQETTYPKGSCDHCKGTNLSPETDIMDTWNTSSVTPEINSNWPDETRIPRPMSMRASAHDIIRTWAFDTIVKSFYHHNSIPWKNIVISGHVLASAKEKISKSKENSKTTPEHLLQQYSADAIRYWSAQGKPGMDTAFSEEQFKMGNRVITKLWNALRFAKPHLEKTTKQIKPPLLDGLSEWILDHARKTLEEVLAAFEVYEYHRALEITERFFWQYFCDNYLELSKDQVFNPQNYDQVTSDAMQYTLHEVGFLILQMYAPILPYITEYLYLELYEKKEGFHSIHLTQLEESRFSCHKYQKSAILFDTLLPLIAEARKLKSEQHLSLKTPIQELTIFVKDEAQKRAFASQQKLLKGICHAECISFEIGTLEKAVLVGTEEQLQMKLTV